VFASRRHKGDFAMGRYEELKTMIKDAVQELQQLETDIKARWALR